MGSAKSLKVLENAAKAAGYAPDDSRALDAYLKILYRSDNKTVLKSAKNLVKSSAPATRCAGLALLLKASGNASGNEILKALKDGNVEYRNTALDFAKETAGEGIFAKVASNFSKLSGDAKVDVVKWLGNNHVNSQEAVILSAVAANDSALSCAGMEAAAKIGSPKALETLIAQLSGRNGEYASKQLLAFNGDISSGVLNVLKTGKDASVLVPALKLAGQRHIHKAYLKVKENDFALSGLLGVDLHNKVAGIMGTGKIGQCMAKICKGYGMTVLGWDAFPNRKLEEEGLLTYVSKDELLQRADLISLHLPLIMGEGGTYHIINDDTIAMMKDNVMLVNTSRGGLVDAEALIRGLKAQKFHAVALDVYEGEDANVYTNHSDDFLTNDIVARLTMFPNLILTSHQAFFTREAMQAIAAITMENARNFNEHLPYGDAECRAK